MSKFLIGFFKGGSFEKVGIEKFLGRLRKILNTMSLYLNISLNNMYTRFKKKNIYFVLTALVV